MGIVVYGISQPNFYTISTGLMDIKDDISLLDATWLSLLRQRFAGIAARRVPEDAIEDIVHDALGIVLAKGPAEALRNNQSEPSLQWSFNVLRNVIGNWYQRRRHHETLEGVEFQDDGPDALAALTTAERVETIRSAVEELRQARPRCAHWLWSMAQGIKAGVLAEGADMESSAFYRKIYRCRKILAEILLRKGVTS